MKEHFCPAEQSTITYQGECSWCGESEGSMTQDEIIDMARQVGIEAESDTLCRFGGWVEPFVAFANLVAAKEREACAKVCEDGINNATDWDSSAWDQACENRSYAIRARGNP